LDILSSGVVHFFSFFKISFGNFQVICPGRSGSRKGERNEERRGCYAALPPSSSTLQHNSIRTQTFNSKKRNYKTQFFAKQSEINIYRMFREYIASLFGRKFFDKFANRSFFNYKNRHAIYERESAG